MTKPFMPMAATQPAETFLADEGLKTDTRGLLQAAKNRIESETTANVLEKLGVGGSGKTKDSSDLTGIAALFTAAQGGANQTMGNAVNLLMGLLARKDNQKENGNTPGTNLDDILKLILVLKAMNNEQGQDNSQLAMVVTMMQEISKSNMMAMTSMLDSMKQDRDEWKERASYQDPMTAHLNNHVYPQYLQGLIGKGQKGLVEQLSELKAGVEALGGTFNLFGGRDSNATTPEERIKMRQMDIEEKRIRTDDIQHKREHFVRHNAPLQWGKGIGQFAAQFAGNNAPMSQDSTLAGLFGGGPEGDPMMQGGGAL